MVNAPVRQPSLTACCAAFVQAPIGLFRPRPPDHDFLNRLTDAGLPRPQHTVRIRALRQVPKSVPTAGIVEGTRRPRRIPLAMTTFVIEHPYARFIVDPGMCTDVAPRVLSQLPAVLRVAVHPPADAIPTAAALTESLDGQAVDFALPTHLHWDHICGLLDLPNMPLRVHRRELEWVTDGAVAPVGGVRESLRDRPISTFDLDGPPVSTFQRSHDLFGDGAVLLVDLAGHTPGSMARSPMRTVACAFTPCIASTRSRIRCASFPLTTTAPAPRCWAEEQSVASGRRLPEGLLEPRH